MKIPNYTEKIIEFIDEVNKVASIKDNRQMVLLMGVYSEYLVNELLFFI